MKKIRYSLLTASLLTGVASMIYELIWVRYLSLILGNSVYAVGVVTACYMTGLACGSFLVGIRLDKHPQVTTKLVFGGVILCCLFSPLSYALITAFNKMLMDFIPVSENVGILPRVFIASAALLLPTGMIGGFIPVLVKLSGPREAGKIYAFHTLGAVLGAVCTSFAGIRFMGLSRSAATAGGIVLISMFLLPKKPVEIFESVSSPVKQKKTVAIRETVYSRKVKAVTLVVYALSGFTGMTFQIYQTKILTLFFMDSIFDFAVILAVYLSGMFVGNLFSTSLANRTEKHVELLAYSQIGLGAFSVLSLYIVNRLPLWTQGINSQWKLYEQFGHWHFMWGILIKTGYAVLVVAIPAILWGFTFPMVSRICIVKSSEHGKMVGIVLGWNTAGSALGSISAAFFLISALGIRNALLCNGLLNFGMGIALLTISECLMNNWHHKRAMVVSVLAMALMFLLLPEWNRFEMSTSFLKPGQEVEGHIEMPYYREDAYGITSVVNFLPFNQKYLTTNRLYCQNTSGLMGAEDHRRLGMIPLFIHQHPKDVLVAGLGAGVTLRGVNEYGALDIDCVEISRSVVEAAAFFKEENADVLNSEQVNIVIDDARNFLRSTDKYYDVIIADIFFPMSSGSSNMFSTEYYQLCKSRLKENGLMAQWIPMHQFSQEEIEIVLKTFSGVFSYTSLWYGLIGDSVPVLGIIGSDEHLQISYDKLAAFYESNPLQAQHLATMALDDPYMFLSHFITTVEARSFGGDIPINCDDRPILEFLNPRQVQPYILRGQENLIKLNKMKASCAPFVLFSESNQNQILLEYDREIVEFVNLLTTSRPANG